MQTVHGCFNGSVVELSEDAPVEGESHVLVTFLEGSLETAAAREHRLGHFSEPIRPPHFYGEELRNQMAKQYRRFTVGAIMTRNPSTIARTAKVADALHLMRQKGITSMLVEPDNNGEWGIMTMRDVLKHIVVDRRSPDDVAIGDIATINLIRATPDAAMDECAQMMLDGKVRRVVIYENNKPVGIVSDTDIFQFVEERGWGNEA